MFWFRVKKSQQNKIIPDNSFQRNILEEVSQCVKKRGLHVTQKETKPEAIPLTVMKLQTLCGGGQNNSLPASFSNLRVNFPTIFPTFPKIGFVVPATELRACPASRALSSAQRGGGMSKADSTNVYISGAFECDLPGC